MRRAFAAVLVSAATLFLVVAPRAQTPANMLSELGMMGRWAADCSRPAGGNNPHIVFERSRSGSGAQYRVIFDADRTTTRSVDNVRALPDNQVAMRFTTMSGDTAGLAFDIVMLKEPARWKVFASTGSDGKVYIKDGIVVATGAQNPWQNKCQVPTG
jgi:hypothetical protein